MQKHYLFFVSLAYSYPVLRPLQDEIWRRGDDAAWYIEDSAPVLLEENEKQLKTFQEVFDYNPIAVFAPGTFVYDFFPGIKVTVFHGYTINKRNEKADDHFALRGWFDIYCTQGPSSTIPFKELEQKYGYFEVYETGWCKLDAYFQNETPPILHDRPVVLYSSTFTKNITSAPVLFDEVTRMVKKNEWDWIITFHPKFTDQKVIGKYKELASQCPNVAFHEDVVTVDLLRQADVMLCDSSAIIIEFMLLDRPVVTYCNTQPGNHLLNVTRKEEIEPAIRKAMLHPKELMDNIHLYLNRLEAHFDGKSSSRVLDAVNDYLLHFKGKLKPKPLNLVRKLKLRMKLKYYRWLVFLLLINKNLTNVLDLCA